MLSAPQFCDGCGAANRQQASFCRACGQALHTSLAAPSFSSNAGSISSTLTGLLSQNTTLKQRYVILNPAGRGGFGAVYKAADTEFGNRLVAVKEMSQNSLKPEELVEASQTFHHEAMLLAGLTHPNLPRIYEQFTDTGRSYLVMDFIEGETLEERLHKQSDHKLPFDQALSISLQLCDVLNYLHTRQPPIIFRDLKPSNIMLIPDGHIYLIDFGIARHFKPGQEKDTTALGSSGYAAPEQYGKSQSTTRADIYALGATMHQMLSGEDPSETPFQFAPLHLKQPGLADLVMGMTSIDINQRPQSVAAIQSQLQSIAYQHRSAPVRTTQPQYTMPPQPPLPKKTTSKTARRKSSTNIIPQLNLIYACTGHSSRITTVAWSPNGKRIATACYDKTVRIWDAVSGQHLLTYKGHSLRVQGLAWSPDSKRLVSVSDDKSAQLWDAQTGSLVFAYYGHQGRVNTVAWSPGGLHIASAGEDRTIHVWNINTHLMDTSRSNAAEIKALAWSPDGRRIASAGSDRRITIWEPFREPQRRSLLSRLFVHQPDLITLKEHHGTINDLSWSSNGQYLASASNDQTAQVWNIAQNRHYGSMRSPVIVNAVAWSPNSLHLAVGGNDKSVHLWNPLKKMTTFTYSGHTSGVMTVAWSPDGTRVASAGIDRTLQVWQVK